MTPDHLSDWLNNLYVSKDPMARFACVFITHSWNKYIIRLRHNTRLVDAVLLRLTGVKHFVIIDCSSFFFILRLTFNSLLLTAFGTIYGMYRYKRMCIRASPSSDILKVTFNCILTSEEYPFMCSITDNIVIFGYAENRSDHDRNVWQVLKTAHHEGMKFKKM